MFTVKMIPNYQKEEGTEVTERRSNYQSIIRQHGSLQLSTSHMVFPGLFEYEKKLTLRRKDANMNDVEPTVKSMREVIEGIELNGEKVFLLVTDLGQKRVAGFFSNVVKGVYQKRNF